MITTTEILAIRLLDTGLRTYYKFSRQECYAEWALTQLMAGRSSYYLNILSGVTFVDNYFEADFFFIAALKELNIAMPSKKDAIRNFVIEICQKILNKDISTHEACNKLASVARETKDDEYYTWIDLSYQDHALFLSEKESELLFDEEVNEEAKLFLAKHNLIGKNN